MVSTMLVTLTAIASLAYAVESKHTEGTGYISFPLTRRTHADLAGKNAKRQESVVATDRLTGTLYTLDITLGSPGQTVPVQFDTGSTELWVNPTCSESINAEFCEQQPRFTQSDTLKILDSVGSEQYKVGWANFRYVEDSVCIGSAKVSQQKFGAAYQSYEHTVGVLGAAPSYDGWVNKYPTLFDNLASQGHIQSRSFSMNLRGFKTDQGAIILGGLDTGKFSGRLEKLAVVPAESAPDKRRGPLLDSGYTMSSLPHEMFIKLLAAFPEAEKRQDHYYKVDCLPEGEGGSVSFTFGSVTIDVPYYDFVFHVPTADNYCVLGVYEHDIPVLGDNFLRAAYAIFDFDHQAVHIAPSDSCGSNIVTIGTEGVTITEGDCGKN